MYLILSISLLGSIFYTLFKLLEKTVKNDLSSNFYYNLSKIVALFFIIPISYILSLYLPSLNNIDFSKFSTKTENVIQVDENILNNNNKDIQDNNLSPVISQNTNHNEKSPYIKDNKISKININYSLIFKTTYITGIILFIFLNLLFFIKFKLTVKKSKQILNNDYNNILNITKQNLNINKNILLFENKIVSSPMLVGILNPRIILPKKQINIADLELILTHELIHFKRKDLITKLILLFINTLNFFNPLIYLLIKDIDKWCEYSCDEKIIKIFNKNNKKNYCIAILNSLNPNKNNNIHFSTTFACNKHHLKRRLENIMSETKPKNKIKLTLAGSFFSLACIIFVLTFSLYYTNNKTNVFAKPKPTRTFEQPISLYSGSAKILKNGQRAPLTTEVLPEFKKKQLTPNIALKGTFIKEEPSVGDIQLKFHTRKFSNETAESTDKYIKIELENIGKHKDDKNNTFDLRCFISALYYNELDEKYQNLFLGKFSVPKDPKNNKVTFVFESIPELNNYELSFNHLNGYAPSFNITVTTGYTLEALGIKNISNLSTEKTEFLKYTDDKRLNNLNPNLIETNGGGKRTFNINSGYYKNLNLKIANKSQDEYVIFMYDVSSDVYTYDNPYNKPVYKEYTINANSVLDKNFSDTICKEYEIHIIPKTLRNDYLKLQKLNENLSKEYEKTGLGIEDNNSKTAQEYKTLGRKYYDKYEEILKRQEGTISYKSYNN